MSTDTMTATQVYRVYIKATPQAIWDAITKPEWTERYGYTNRADFDLRPGGAYKAYASEAMKRGGEANGIPVPDVVVDGEVPGGRSTAQAGHHLADADGPRARRRRASPA